MLPASGQARGKQRRLLYRYWMYKLFILALARPHIIRRTLATVTEPPVRRYGGLKDQASIIRSSLSLNIGL